MLPIHSLPLVPQLSAIFLLWLLPVVPPRPVAVAYGLPDALVRAILHPAVGLLRVARHAVEQGAEQLGRAQVHVFIGLIDEQLIERELIGGDVAVQVRFGLHELGQFPGIDRMRY